MCLGILHAYNNLFIPYHYYYLSLFVIFLFVLLSSLQGTVRDYERAAEAYMHAKTQANAQAMFNLGYMHEHGQGLPLDLHLAKRYYDEALETDAAAKLPVTLALASLRIRMNYADSFLVSFCHSHALFLIIRRLLLHLSLVETGI